MNFEIKINCDNAAFADNPGQEIGRILNDIAHRVSNDPAYLQGQGETIRDCNGNDIGRFRAI